MKLFFLCLMAMPAPYFDADCPVVKIVEIGFGDPDPVCLFGMVDCADSGSSPDYSYADCAGETCECVDSACDCGEQNVGPLPEPAAETEPESNLNPEQNIPGSGPTAQAAPVEAETKTFELGQPRTFDGRVLRSNQALEGRSIRLTNKEGEDPAANLIKVSEQLGVDLVTSVRFSPGTFFTEEAYFALYELTTTAPVKYQVNGQEASIPAGKKFHLAIRLAKQPATLSNSGRSYRALVRSDSKDSPQEGVITVGDVEYHALGRK